MRAKRDEWLKAREEGKRPPDKRLAVGTYLRRWLDSLSVRERTAESYRSTLERHVLPRIGPLLLAQLGPLDIDEMLAGMAKSGVRPPTRAYALRVLSVALNVAVTRKRLIPYNPALGADRPVVKRRQPVMLTDDEMARFLAALEGDRFEPLFRLLASTAIRRGEALALRWSCWNREAGTLTIDRTLLYRVGRGYELVQPKTHMSVRVLRLSKSASAALRQQARTQAEERLRHGRTWKDHDLIFTSEQHPGEPLNGSTIVHALHRIADSTAVVDDHGNIVVPAIRRFRVHDLRHFAATVIAEDAGLATAQAVLGHSSPSMTGRYSHPSATSQAAADAIDRRFLPVKGEEEAL